MALLKLIDEISRSGEDRIWPWPLSPEPVSLAEVMLECRGIIETQAQLKGIQLTFPGSTLLTLSAPTGLGLKQVLINLLSNAIKYNTEQEQSR